jgi:GntR family histidine utilization transcriptional repressor
MTGSRKAYPRRLKTVDETPFYLTIKTDISSAIANGRLKPGDRVASEHELVRRYSVSRMTANRALRELAQEGLVIRLRGVGSFVAEAPVMTDFLVLRNVAEEIRQRGRAYGQRLVDKGEIRASSEVAAGLGLAPAAPVFHALLVHTQDGTPVQVEDRYVNPAAAPAFLTIDLASHYPGSYLDSIAPADEVEHIVEAVLAERRERDLLGISAGEPCLRLIRRTWSMGTPVSFIWFTYPGRFYRLKARFPLARSEAPVRSGGDY